MTQVDELVLKIVNRANQFISELSLPPLEVVKDGKDGWEFVYFATMKFTPLCCIKHRGKVIATYCHNYQFGYKAFVMKFGGMHLDINNQSAAVALAWKTLALHLSLLGLPVSYGYELPKDGTIVFNLEVEEVDGHKFHLRCQCPLDSDKFQLTIASTLWDEELNGDSFAFVREHFLNMPWGVALL